MAKKQDASGQEYEQHPVAVALMPGGMNDEEFDAFCEDVEQRGILMPATLYEGKVLDGWHRYRAHLRTKKPITYVKYEGKDPAGYVASCNVLRRKLSSLQKALVGAKLHLNHAITQRDVCRRLSISNTVLTMVLKALDNRCSQIIKRIENDSDYTRGMLREELEELQIIHANYGRSKADPDGEPEYADTREVVDGKEVAGRVANSPFSMGSLLTTRVPEDTDPAVDFRPIGKDVELPEIGKKPSHPERRAKNTEAENMKKRFLALDDDTQRTFLQMVWPDAQPILEDMGLLKLKVKA